MILMMKHLEDLEILDLLGDFSLVHLLYLCKIRVETRNTGLKSSDNFYFVIMGHSSLQQL